MYNTKKTKDESYNTRASKVIGSKCFKLTVSNYGPKQSSFVFYTGSDRYAVAKKDFITKRYPDAIVIVEEGVIEFIPVTSDVTETNQKENEE